MSDHRKKIVASITVSGLGKSMVMHKMKCSACKYGITCAKFNTMETEYKRQITFAKNIGKEIKDVA